MLNMKLQLGQPGQCEAPRLVLEVGGTSTLQAAIPGQLKSSLLQEQVWGVHAGLTQLHKYKGNCYPKL